MEVEVAQVGVWCWGVWEGVDIALVSVGRGVEGEPSVVDEEGGADVAGGGV